MSSSPTSHQAPPPSLPSDRSFGTVFVVFFAALAFYGWTKGATWFVWPLSLSVITAVLTLLLPQVLRPFNRLWMRLAEVLHHIVSPLVLGLMFFALITPTAYVIRAIGRDAMKRKSEPALKSYWIERSPPGPDPASLPNQF